MELPKQGVVVTISPGSEDDYPATVIMEPGVEFTSELGAETVASVLKSVVDESGDDFNPVAFQMAVMKALSE